MLRGARPGFAQVLQRPRGPAHPRYLERMRRACARAVVHTPEQPWQRLPNPTPSATHPEAAEEQADACRNQDGLERTLEDELFQGAFHVLHGVASLLTQRRRAGAQVIQMLMGNILGEAAHISKVLTHFLGLVVKPAVRGARCPCAFGLVGWHTNWFGDRIHELPF